VFIVQIDTARYPEQSLEMQRKSIRFERLKTEIMLYVTSDIGNMRSRRSAAVACADDTTY